MTLTNNLPAVARGTVEFAILASLCAMPRPVRGMSEVMINRHHDDPAALESLAAAGLVRSRGWDAGPGAIWIPTDAGEKAYREAAHTG